MFAGGRSFGAVRVSAGTRGRQRAGRQEILVSGGDPKESVQEGIKAKNYEFSVKRGRLVQ